MLYRGVGYVKNVRGMKDFKTKIRNYLEFIKFSHTIFALPFALVAMLVAAHGLPAGRVLVWILVCMVAARTAAMSFNRWADWEFDRHNPRTQNRSTLATRGTAFGVTLAALGLFIVGAGQLNRLCLLLSPLAIVLVLGYSLTKRFTPYSHAFLGLALAAAPMGAWAASTGTLAVSAPWILALAVWCWVFGFDLIYATMDIDYDRRAGLYSFPSRYGIEASLGLAKALHLATILVLCWFGWTSHLGMAYWIAFAVTIGALIYEHALCRERDIRRINQAFFQMNALVSMTLLVGTTISVWNKY